MFDEVWFRISLMTIAPAIVLFLLRKKDAYELARIKKYFIVIFFMVLLFKAFSGIPELTAKEVFVGIATILLMFMLWNRWLYTELFLSESSGFEISYKTFEVIGLYLLLACIFLSAVA